MTRDPWKARSAAELAPEDARALSGGKWCEGCGKELRGGRPQRRFCNGRCRARASRARKAGEWRAVMAQIERLVGTELRGYWRRSKSAPACAAWEPDAGRPD